MSPFFEVKAFFQYSIKVWSRNVHKILAKSLNQSLLHANRFCEDFLIKNCFAILFYYLISFIYLMQAITSGRSVEEIHLNQVSSKTEKKSD